MNQVDDFQLELGKSSEVAMMIILATMMFSVALTLRPEHFRFFKTQPRLFFSGVAGQLIGLPVITLALCMVFQPPASIAMGMILIACCPGGNVSNLLVLYAKGNAALSVSLTAASSFCAAFITPVAILFWCSLYPPTNNLLTEINIDKIDFLIQTSIILVLPLFVGMFIARYFERFTSVIQKPLVILSSCGLLLVTVSALVKYFDRFLVLGLSLFALVVLHNACAFGVGWISGRLARADTASSRALIFEVGIQNSGLGIVILLTQLGGLGGAAVVAGLWGTWHIIAGLALVFYFRRFAEKN